MTSQVCCSVLLIMSVPVGHQVIQIPLIVLPLSHEKIRRILGWVLLPLSTYLVHAQSTKKRPNLGAPNRTQVGVYSINPDVPCNTSHICIPPKYGPPTLNPSGDPIDPGSQISPGSCGIQNYPPSNPHNQSQVPLG